MRANQVADALLRAHRSIDGRKYRRVIALQHFQKQRACQFLLRSEEMEEAAVRGSRPGANGRDGGALEAVAIEHRQSRSQQILSGTGNHIDLSSEPRLLL